MEVGFVNECFSRRCEEILAFRTGLAAMTHSYQTPRLAMTLATKHHNFLRSP